MLDYYHSYLSDVFGVLDKCEVFDGLGSLVSIQEGMDQWCQITLKLNNEKKSLFFIGNGASAGMAGHMATDAGKNGGLRARSFNDSPMLTAFSGDLTYEQVFASLIKRFGSARDVLITISSSGNSPNIIAAIETAKTLGLTVVTLSGFKPDNLSRTMGDLNFYVPAFTYGHAETAHQILLHCWLDYYVEKYKT